MTYFQLLPEISAITPKRLMEIYYREVVLLCWASLAKASKTFPHFHQIHIMSMSLGSLRCQAVCFGSIYLQKLFN